MGCRDLNKADIAAKDIKDQNMGANIVVMKLDLSSLKSVREFAEEVSNCEQRIDILINNAGVMTSSEWQTEDGYEMQFQTNYLGLKPKNYIKNEKNEVFYIEIQVIFY